MNIFGYFEDPKQDVPTFDPGRGALCPICLSACGGAKPLVTVSLMRVGDARSYFFRAHKDCWKTASEQDKQRVEHSLIDATPESSHE